MVGVDSTTTDAPGAVEDGRRLRRDRNRDAVVDAMLELFREGSLAPSSEEIAARAGLSARSLFRYFDDIDDLSRAAINRHLERIRPTINLGVTSGGSIDARIAALVEQRLRMFDAIASVGIVSRLRAPFQPVIAAQLTQARAFLRGQIKRLFRAELTAMSEQSAASLLSVIDVIASFEAYHLLRQDQQLTQAEAGTVLTDAIAQLLALPPRSAAGPSPDS